MLIPDKNLNEGRVEGGRLRHGEGSRIPRFGVGFGDLFSHLLLLLHMRRQIVISVIHVDKGPINHRHALKHIL